MSKLLIFFTLKLIALFAFSRAIFLILKLDRFKELYGGSMRTILKYFFICLISYKCIEVSYGLIEQFELLNTK